ncbi:serine carboxypeptidase-like 46 isoform X1 [Triticum dicoccoides]|uniref:serine carboxypeptidase-like 46 isoform X1 n=1 Tax=Triticum dicoccoides TaxID=85692 RepID=UPI00188F61EB|nr:serine carboxypeptidase-like 46 isoform X1 [Triticum dicoccoides]
MHPGTSVAAVVCAAAALLISNGCLSMAMVEDKITALPGQPPVSFAQYSGYVEVDAMRKRSLFYYFAEAELDPATKPLVLWLNGGPGCSSVGVGAFSENGPFRPSGNALVGNEYSWNKEANMLYLESPAGVGFSYSTDPSFYGGVGDSMTARDNLRFLEGWFAKFPQYKGRDLYIAGESYAGHYVPQLAQRMVEFDNKEKLFNLKGIALGNPVLEFSTDFNSRAEFFWSHGLISDSTYNIFTTVCNYSRYVSEYYHGSISTVCDRVMSQVTRETSRFVDKYDVTLDVCISSVLMQSQVLTPSPNVSFFSITFAKEMYVTLSLTDNFLQSTEQLNRALDVCVEDETMNYLNRKDVQKAMHAQLNGVPKWTVCSSVLEYKQLDLQIPTINIVGALVKSGIPVLVYSGDQDSVIPLTGSRTLVHRLAKRLRLNATVPYRVWFQGKQVGGWTQVFSDVLSFATIRGASHEAPFSQPERSLVLFRAFLASRPLPESFE